MRVLVTGSAGFIGRATCFALFKAGHQVASMLDRAYNDAELQHLSVASRVDIRERRGSLHSRRNHRHLLPRVHNRQ